MAQQPECLEFPCHHCGAPIGRPCLRAARVGAGKVAEVAHACRYVLWRAAVTDPACLPSARALSRQVAAVTAAREATDLDRSRRR